MPAAQKNLVQKLAAISKDIGRVPKNGYNSFHKYKYVLEADLVDHIRPLLADQNIFIVPRATSHYREEDLTVIEYEYDIIDGDSGDKLTTSAVGYGADRGDKGAYKASTGAFKYCLMRLFAVATGDDPEGDTRTDQRTSSTSSPAAQPRITDSNVQGVQVGGRTTNSNVVQVREAKLASQSLGLGVSGFRDLIDTVLGDSIQLPEEDSAQTQVLNAYLENLEAEDLGKLISAMRQLQETLEDAPA